MNTVSMVTEKLEQLAPKAAACDWDNPGLLVGRSDREVSRIYVALDASCAVVDAAIDAGCDLIVTHHPIIFRGLKSINDQSALGLKLLDLIRNDVSVFSMHTNFDSCPGGMADIVCAALGLRKTGLMEPTGFLPKDTQNGAAEGLQLRVVETEHDVNPDAYGIGFTAELPEMLSAAELATRVKACFGLPFVQYYDAGMPIRRIACCPGSGRGELKEVLSLGVDAFLSGDMGHHEGLDLCEEGISLLDAGHYGLEHIFVHYIAEFLRTQFPEAEIIEEELHFPAQIV
ncbi:MAG: Nif3-like dinuclear metal center hexameric protein [Oribacterium sp.]|nr:Nif3-like dinuclear metal center hexameric protein [Oribacterium sp.]